VYQSVKECHLVWVVVAVFRSLVVEAADPAFLLQRYILFDYVATKPSIL
jgi:hypothetical protein